MCGCVDVWSCVRQTSRCLHCYDTFRSLTVDRTVPHLLLQRAVVHSYTIRCTAPTIAVYYSAHRIRARGVWSVPYVNQQPSRPRFQHRQSNPPFPTATALPTARSVDRVLQRTSLPLDIDWTYLLSPFNLRRQSSSPIAVRAVVVVDTHPRPLRPTFTERRKRV